MARRSTSRLLPIAGVSTAAAITWMVVGAISGLLAAATAAQAFPAPVTAPVASTADPTAITDTSATLSGTVTPSEPTALAFFEYGTTASYGRTTPEVHLTGAGEQAITADATALQPATTYHYRLLAANGTGTTRTVDAIFTTGPSTAITPAASAIGAVGGPTGPSAGAGASGAAPAPAGSMQATRPASISVGNGGGNGIPSITAGGAHAPTLRLPLTCASGPTCSGAVAIIVQRRSTLTDPSTSVSVASSLFMIPSGTRVTLAMTITPATRTLITQAKRRGQRLTAAITLDAQPTSPRTFVPATKRRP